MLLLLLLNMQMFLPVVQGQRSNRKPDGMVSSHPLEEPMPLNYTGKLEVLSSQREIQETAREPK